MRELMMVAVAVASLAVPSASMAADAPGNINRSGNTGTLNLSQTNVTIPPARYANWTAASKAM